MNRSEAGKLGAKARSHESRVEGGRKAAATRGYESLSAAGRKGGKNSRRGSKKDSGELNS